MRKSKTGSLSGKLKGTRPSALEGHKGTKMKGYTGKTC